MNFAQDSGIDHSWNLLLPVNGLPPTPISSICTCTDAFSNQPQLASCCSNSQCKSGFCLCESAGAVGKCYVAPTYTPSTVNSYCAIGKFAGVTGFSVFVCGNEQSVRSGGGCSSSLQCNAYSQCLFPLGYSTSRINGATTRCLAAPGASCP
jgi:hypothetical protein